MKIFELSEKFKDLAKDLKSDFIHDLNLRSHFLTDDNLAEEIIPFLTNEFIQLGYTKPVDDYIKISDIDTFYLHAWLEVDDYASQIECNIEKVYVNLTLLDYDEELWYEGQPEDEKALWKTFRSFDTRPDIGDGKMAVFSIKEGVSPPAEPPIYFVDRAKAFKTNLTFVQYFEAVLDMIGIADWQLLFADISWNDPQVEDYYPGLKESLEALAKAFPEKDYSRYFELLESKWEK